MQSTKIISIFLTASLLLLFPLRAEAKEADGAAFFRPEIYFFGESTTAHLSRREGVLDTDRDRHRVLRDGSGTRMLERRILSSPVLLDGECVPLADAVERLAPPVLVLSFGLNGLFYHVSHPDRFLGNYRLLIDGIRARSPSTRIYLQSVYPVGENTVFSESSATVNEAIRTLNARIASACADWGDATYLDTSHLLLDASGGLDRQYDVGDGIHLTNAAYQRLLAFLEARIGKEQS